MAIVIFIFLIGCFNYQYQLTDANKVYFQYDYSHGTYMPLGSFPEQRAKTANDILEQNTIEADDNSESDDTYEIFLDSGKKFHLRWEVDYKNRMVLMTIDAVLTANQWIGIGFSDYGEVENAFLCILWRDMRYKSQFQDAWTDEKGNLHVDKKQNCKLLTLRRKDNRTIFKFSRAFDSCNSDGDYVIDEGTVHIIYASGDGPIDSADGLSISNSKHGFQRAQLLKVPAEHVAFPSDTVTFSVLSNKVQVPNVETTYWCRVVKLANMKSFHHIIQFEAVIVEGNEGLVHHMEVFHCEVEFGKQVPLYSGPCDGSSRPQSTQTCKKVIAAWAMGAQPFVYPKEAGLPIGGPTYSPYVMLEVHYNNPELRNDYVDSSGIKFYYTSQLRPNDAAVLEIGLEYSNKMAIPPQQKAFSLSGHCIIECTEVALPVSGIVLFAAQLHTHSSGKQVYVKHYRGGMELCEMARDDHYSPHFQEIRTLRNRVLLLPGDALVATCAYDTSQRTNITLGGFSISDEMCVSYIHYFPKSNLEVCKSSIDSDVLNNYFEFENKYEDQPTSPSKTVAENYQSISWTPLRSQILHQLYNQATLSMQCNQSSGERFPGYWNDMPQTAVLLPRKNSPRLCDGNSNEYDVEN
ncbi:hypothetical protein CHUAL_013726 [Chamberlinius hualienensis]